MLKALVGVLSGCGPDMLPNGMPFLTEHGKPKFWCLMCSPSPGESWSSVALVEKCRGLYLQL